MKIASGGKNEEVAVKIYERPLQGIQKMIYFLSEVKSLAHVKSPNVV